MSDTSGTKNELNSAVPRVELAPGTGLVGAVHKATDKDVPVFAFKGIPYAQPPLGELRFQAPQPVKLWEGDRDATEYGAICMQDTTMFARLPMKVKVPEKISEDCLFLNVWTPTLDEKENKAVMVFIHGGGFVGGYSDMTEGTAISSYENVVFVSINYRNGIFGFLSTGDDVVPGNNGLKDQVEALCWIKKYIHKFGGDPNNVTIYGESAGAISVSALMLSDQAAGLFHKAICQSGTIRVQGYVWSQAYAREKLSPLLERMGYQGKTSVDILNFLKGQTGESIVKAGSLEEGYRPVTDEEFLTKECIISCRNEKSANIPLMVGCNSSEAAMMIHMMADFKIPDMETCKQMMAPLVQMGFNPKADADEVLGHLWKEYFESCTGDEIVKRFTDMGGDMMFVYPMVVVADLHCGGADTYIYYLSFTPSFNTYPEWVECDHGNEIPYIAGWPLYDQRQADMDLGFTEKDIAMSKTMIKYWANFAKTGNPNGGSLPEWPKYTESNRAYINLNTTISTGNNLRENRVAFWKETMKTYGVDLIVDL